MPRPITSSRTGTSSASTCARASPACGRSRAARTSRSARWCASTTSTSPGGRSPATSRSCWRRCRRSSAHAAPTDRPHALLRGVSSRVAVILVLVAAMAAAGARVITTTGSPRSCARAQGRPEGAPAAQPDPSGARALYSGPRRELEGACKDRPGHPESFLDLARANSARLTRTVAPGTQIRAGAYRSAVAHAADLPRTGGTWRPYGRPPLIGDRTQYDTSNGSTNQGLPDLSGRASGFARSGDGVLYAAISNGGVWRSTDGTNWSSIGDGLPTQVVSSVAWTPAGGGTLLALTGDNAYGGDTYAGQGLYRTTDDGAHWQHAAGIPDGLLGFKVAVDPTDPS